MTFSAFGSLKMHFQHCRNVMACLTSTMIPMIKTIFSSFSHCAFIYGKGWWWWKKLMGQFSRKWYSNEGTQWHVIETWRKQRETGATWKTIVNQIFSALHSWREPGQAILQGCTSSMLFSRYGLPILGKIHCVLFEVKLCEHQHLDRDKRNMVLGYGELRV